MRSFRIFRAFKEGRTVERGQLSLASETFPSMSQFVTSWARAQHDLGCASGFSRWLAACNPHVVGTRFFPRLTFPEIWR